MGGGHEGERGCKFHSWLLFTTSLLSILVPSNNSNPSLGLELGLGLKFTELVERVLVLCPSLVSRVDLLGLASKQASSTREMGKNQNSVVVLLIWSQFWWMIPMGVKYNHTKFEQETQWWQPGTGVASGGPPFQNAVEKMPKTAIFGQKQPYNPFKADK